MTTTAPWLGINPAECLKDSDTRHSMVGVAGFEPAAFRSQSGRATNLRHTPGRGPY